MRSNDTAMNYNESGTDYQARFDQLQTRFIDEPKEAVREAGNLVRETVDRLFEGDQHDTEQLRRVMQGYRDLLARLSGHEIDGHDAGGREIAGNREIGSREIGSREVDGRRMDQRDETMAEANSGRDRTETMQSRSATQTDELPADRAADTETS